MSARPWRRSRTSQSGQMVPLLALMLAVLTGFAGLTVDLAHEFSQKRIGQTAVDAAALAGTTQWGNEQSMGGVIQSPPSAYNDAAVAAAHDYIAADGFPTVWYTSPPSGGCYTNNGVQFTEIFFSAGWTGTCANPTSFQTELTVNIPPLSYAGSTTPKNCDSTLKPPGYPDNCVQVVVTQKVTNYIMQVFGFNSETLTTFATGYSNPSSSSSVPLPSPYAVQLYQKDSLNNLQNPVGDCNAPYQCFNEGAVPARPDLGCQGPDSNNCPTLLAGAQATIEGVDSQAVTPGTTTHDAAAMSNGDIVANQQLTFCDAYGFDEVTPSQNKPTCNNNPRVGDLGW
ncbi:MAG: Tad domain-containing protein, partial [Candidatus Dormibacteraeota bacterium]|nr:Tad domain-containing protein [Candidatus Dormibacteraeota bacterium]